MSQLKKPSIGVGAVILSEDQSKILLVLRNKPPEKDTWSIPGGKVELFETLEDAVIREVDEEIGLTISKTKLLCTAETISRQSDEHWISVIYTAIAYRGVPRNREPEAIQEIDWFPLSALPSNIACFTRPALIALNK